MEREKGFEPSTLALARRCSTTELFPLSRGLKKRGDSTETGGHCQAAQPKNSYGAIQFINQALRGGNVTNWYHSMMDGRNIYNALFLCMNNRCNHSLARAIGTGTTHCWQCNEFLSRAEQFIF